LGLRETKGWLVTAMITSMVVLVLYWAFCFVSFIAVIVAIFVPIHYGIKDTRKIRFYGTILFLILGLVVGEFYSLVTDVGDFIGVEDWGLYGWLNGLVTFSLPSIILLWVMASNIRMEPKEESQAPLPTPNDKRYTASKGEYVPEKTGQVMRSSRKCPYCNTMLLGSELKCWQCGKRS